MKKSTLKFISIIAVVFVSICFSGCKNAYEKPGSGFVKQEYYEFRVYRIESAENQKIVSNYLEKALLPALKRMSLDRIGVFTAMKEGDDYSIYVLIPYPNLEFFGQMNSKLAADKKYNSAAKDYFAIGKKDAPYTRIESRFMKAFACIPVMEIPDESRSKSARMFEVRIYESHNADKARLKVDMFNSGEAQVMRDTKLAPVFFGETLIGSDVPNLTYMLSAPNMEAHKKHWGAFMEHPEWNRMKKLAKYADTVSKITKVYLVPTKYSQL